MSADWLVESVSVRRDATARLVPVEHNMAVFSAMPHRTHHSRANYVAGSEVGASPSLRSTVATSSAIGSSCNSCGEHQIRAATRRM